MPIIQLGNKIRQFKQLAVLQRRRLDRSTGPFSAYQRDNHRENLHFVADILKQDWSVLLFERDFFQSSQTYTEYLTKTQVVDKLLEALEAYEKCLTHQADVSNDVQYDLTDLERHLNGAIHAVHDAGQTANYEIERRPKSSWKCLKEYQGWRASCRDLMNPKKGKLRIGESEFPQIGRLLDGMITVTLSGEEDEDAEELPLGDTLPENLVNDFDEAFKNATDVDMKMEPPVPQRKAMIPFVAPQGRTNVAFSVKGIEDVAIDSIETEDNGGDVAPPPLQKQPPIRLNLYRKRVRFAEY